MTQIHQVQPSEKLFRWLHPSQFKWDEGRPTSAAFKDPYMSVDIACLTSLEESYKRAKKINKNAVVSIVVQQAFDKTQKVHHCPSKICESSGSSVCVTDECCPAYQGDRLSNKLVCINDAHGCVVGEKKNSIAKFFAKECTVEIYPPKPEHS
jgi:hypothetical protein